LSGRFRGRRVILLGTLPSGLLLVTGPFKVNGVPLKRVNPAYVIATSTSVDLSNFELPHPFNENSLFRRKKETSLKNQDPEKQFEQQDAPKEEKKSLPQERLDLQKVIDEQLNGVINQVPLLKSYLQSKFTLDRNQFPHLLKF